MLTRVKMCAMTRIEDAQLAVELGAAAIGLVFYEKSARFVTIEQAQAIVMEVPPYVTITGIFVNAAKDYIEAVVQQVPLDLLQFQGHESPANCRRFGRPYVKTIGMNDQVNLMEKCAQYADAKALLLDTQHSGNPGGTGVTFDWSLIPKHLPKPIILAGGLTPENVGSAIRQVKPYAVDLTSGIEASKGIKDPEKIRAFMQAVVAADKEVY